MAPGAVKTLKVNRGFVEDATKGLIAYADVQDVMDERLLGRSAGTAGPPMELVPLHSIALAAGNLTLTNDDAAPGALRYYGTDASSARGWHPLPVATKEGVWRFQVSTTMSDPGAGAFRFDSATPASVAALAIDYLTDNGTDASTVIRGLAMGDTVQIQDQQDATNYARYTLSAAPVDNASWFQLSLTYVSHDGAVPTNNSPCVISFTVAGGGGAGYTDEDAQDAAASALAAGSHVGVSVAYDDTADSLSLTNTDRGSIAVAAHEGLADPHPQYLTVIEGDGAYQPLDGDLTALAALSTTGILTRTASHAVAARTLQAGSGISIANGDGVAGDPTITCTIAPGSGTVTSVAITGPSIIAWSGSPIATAGTFTGTLTDQAANLVLAGPTSGAAAAPTFRSHVTADFPDGVVAYSKIQNVSDARVLGRSAGSAGPPQELTVASPLTLIGGVLGSSATAEPGIVPGGRLSAHSTLPITNYDIAGATAVHYVPYQHDRIALWNGSAWTVLSFTALTLNIGTVTANMNYDIFGYLASGALALEKLAWTNDTNRATAIVRENGRWIKSGDKTRLYLGTFRSLTTTAFDDSSTVRGLYNAYNRTLRDLHCADTSISWSYTLDAWQEARAQSTLGVSRVGVLLGTAEDLVEVVNSAWTYCSASNPACAAGIAIDNGAISPPVNLARIRGSGNDTVSGKQHQAFYRGYPGGGYLIVRRLERASNPGGVTVSWLGSGATAHSNSGMEVTAWL